MCAALNDIMTVTILFHFPPNVNCDCILIMLHAALPKK